MCWFTSDDFLPIKEARVIPFWVGPYLVILCEAREVTVLVGPHDLRVDRGLLKKWHGLEPTVLDQATTPVMSSQEMAAEGFYIVERILRHRRQTNRWLLLTQWEGYAEPTWEPLKHFVQRGQINHTLKDYCREGDHSDLWQAAQTMLERSTGRF